MATMQRELRTHDARVASLPSAAWALYLALMVHIARHTEAWPSLATLVRYTGWSERTVRRASDTLTALGLIVTRRTRRPDGSERIYYAYGPASLEAFRRLAERMPRDRHTGPGPAKARSTDEPDAVMSHPPATVAATPPATVAAELSDLKLRSEPFFCGDAETPASPAPAADELPPPAALEEQFCAVITGDDRAVAREALTERATRRCPGREPPRWWDREVLELVASRVAQTPGTREDQLTAQRMALAGAWLVSRDQAPTVRFIWGTQEHFLAHVERGRRRAESDAREVARRDAGASAPSVRRAVRVGPVTPSFVAADLDVERPVALGGPHSATADDVATRLADARRRTAELTALWASEAAPGASRRPELTADQCLAEIAAMGAVWS
jgi:hypothetical protein